MPEENILSKDVQTALYDLEQLGSNNFSSKSHSYTTVQTAVAKGENISADVLKRLLEVCVHDMSTYSAKAVNLIAVIVSKIKMGSYDPPPDLLHSALAVINMIKSIALLNNLDSLMVLSFKTLLSYPDDTLLCVGNYHEEVLEIFNLCCHINMPFTIRVEVFKFLLKLLQILPQGKKRLFVEKGISIWFSKVIPIVMVDQTNGGLESEKSLEVLELLTDDLLYINYTDNPRWHNVLECICNKKQYPAVMKNLLNADSDGWHRLWIVFIKLLKHQITQSLSTIGSPINSMLPVVEAAFKMDAKKRTKAFECWIVLIDSFSSKINENNINKTLKLLIIPLKSNNARAEDTILAKFQCWWHLLRKFENKMDMFLDTALVSFLQFCFGQDNTDKFVPGMITVNVKRMCNQAIVDIFGHVNCDGCTDLPRLKGKVINTKHLVDSWNHWIYSLKCVLKAANTNYGLTKQQTTCMWKSFILIIGELPENNIRKDLFSSLLYVIIVNFVKDSDINVLDITFNILIMSLFDESPTIKRLFKSDNGLIMKIVNTVLDPSLNTYYKSLTTQELVTKLKPITKLIFDEEVCITRPIISGLLAALPNNNIGLALWAALAETLCKSDYDRYVLIAYNVLLWPLKQIHLFTEVKVAAMTWYTTYDLIYPILNKTDINNEILEICFTAAESNSSVVYFKLCLVLGLLKHKFNTSNSICEKELKLLLDLTKTMNYEYFKPIFPLLVERIVAVMTIVTSNVNDIVTALILVSVKNVLHMLTQAYTTNSSESHVMNLITDLLKPLNNIFAIESYAKLIPDIIYHLLKCFSLLSTHLPIQSTILSILKTILGKVICTDTNYNKIKSLIDAIENCKLKTENKLTSHAAKVLKQTKSKQPNIVETVVDDGEEYVVVKSNWKFNPRKLTEHQKEILQRKREDIPALYQDLSQSQDEFKLASWRPDSQDNTSSSRSESKSNKPDNNETSSDILNNFPGTNVVPRILANFFSENEKISGNVKESSLKDNATKSETSLMTHTKSPRMALKDRVFRNVRNLIENSGIHKENQASSEDPNMMTNKTPTHAKRINLESAVNSAPPLLSMDRPSRVKRKPKKFEDLLLLTNKKRRNSLQDIHSNKHEIKHCETNISNIKNVAENRDSINFNGVSTLEISHSNDDVETNIIDNVVKNNIINENNLNTTVNNESVNINTNANSKQEEKINAAELTILNCEELPQIRTSDINEIQQSGGSDSNFVDPKSSKEPNNVSFHTLTDLAIESRLNLSQHLKVKPSQTTSKGIEEVLPHKISRDCKLVLISNMAKVNKEESTAKIPKLVQGISTPEAVKAAKEVATPITLLSNLTRNAGVNENLGPNTSEEVKVVVTLNNSSDTKEEIPKILINNNKSSDNVDTDIIDLEQSKDIERLSANTSTPSLSKSEKLPVCNIPKVDDHLTSTKSKESSTAISKQTSKCESSTRKNSVRKSRIEKELAIDMVEGHPYLKIQSEKRLTRKTLESVNTGRRKSATQNLAKSKSEDPAINTPKNDKKSKEKIKKKCLSISVVAGNKQEKSSESKEQSSFSDDLPCSEDVIESSQDSTITTISVKSSKNILKSVPFVHLEKPVSAVNKTEVSNSQSILEYSSATLDQSISANQKSNDYIALPLNKTLIVEKNQDNQEKSQENLTENMDTEPLDNQNISGADILLSDKIPSVVLLRENTIVGPETQEIAEADTQPTDSKETMDIDVTPDIPDTSESPATIGKCDRAMFSIQNDTGNNDTETLLESALVGTEQSSGASSPFKDEAQRQKDFLNNTTEISPIKTMSPDRDKKSPSPETSGEYVVIKLTSPVHINGEPFDKSCSPEVFTEDKVSPDKRDLSPPRMEVTLTNTSPSSSLSLKKNRPQVRSGGRAAQMLGLCVPEKVQTWGNQDKNESDEVKKVTMTTPVRRNLRTLYNSVSENTDSSSSTGENDDSDNFLKFRRSLPTVDSSPSVSILKRKLAEITDDALISPMSKRKRVSFHDPPVSTTISVQKYIEPGILRSPQNSAQKRCERLLRQHTPVHSQKRLDNVFKLHNVLTKAVEGFTESEVIDVTDDTQPFSLDETPVVEIVKASELNDTDPICPELIDCTDSIENIAGELSSSAMKTLFIKELEGKVETVGDLAKMTELEVNRLCIKAPKVKVVKKVLSDYITKRIEMVPIETESSIDEAKLEEFVTKDFGLAKSINTEVQTDSIVSTNIGLQTLAMPLRTIFSQTDTVLTTHNSVQTDESGNKSTAAIISSCLSEKPDFVEQLREQLEESTVKQISEKLPLSSITDLLVDKIIPSEVNTVFNRIFETVAKSSNNESEELLYLKNYLCNKFTSRELILFCSQILKSVSDKPV